jgi:multiple sugar transport system substrate-binding protein
MNIYSASVSIPPTDPQTQLAAWLFIRYYTLPEVQAGWERASNYFPVRASVPEGLDEYFAKEPAYEAAFNLLPYSRREPPVADYDPIRDVMTAAFEEILAGGDIDTVLANAEAEAKRRLAKAAP